MNWQEIVSPIVKDLGILVVTAVTGWLSKAAHKFLKKAHERTEQETAKIRNDTMRSIAEEAVKSVEQTATAAVKQGAAKWTSEQKLSAASDWLQKRTGLNPTDAKNLIEAAVHDLNSGMS